jgi:hypothetical protein
MAAWCRSSAQFRVHGLSLRVSILRGSSQTGGDGTRAFAPKAPEDEDEDWRYYARRPVQTIVIPGGKCALLTRSCRTRFVVQALQRPDSAVYEVISPADFSRRSRSRALQRFRSPRNPPLRGTRRIMRAIFGCRISLFYPTALTSRAVAIAVYRCRIVRLRPPSSAAKFTSDVHTWDRGTCC